MQFQPSQNSGDGHGFVKYFTGNNCYTCPDHNLFSDWRFYFPTQTSEIKSITTVENYI